MMKSMAGALVAAFAVCAVQPAWADGDAALGKAVFNKCMACHDARKETNKVGPHLVGVIGRTAGTVAGYKYSQPMIDAGAGGLVWDETSIAEYLKAPKEKVPGNKMAFAGLKKDEDIANLIAWLQADPKP